MKPGDIVITKDSAGYRRRCVALAVTKRDIASGVNARSPGTYAFRGYWYGANPRDHNSYGKIEGKVGRVIGRVRSDQQIRCLGI